MNKKVTSLAITAVALLGTAPAMAYVEFTGVDANGAETVLAATPNSTAAATSFLSNLVGVGTETFEGRSIGTAAPLLLNFSGAGTAQLTGSSGSVQGNPPGLTNGVGRYSVPGGTRFWEVSAGGGATFSITFSQEIAAFGFYGIDIGDFAGTLQVELLDDTNTLITSRNVPSAASAVANGSVLFLGLLASNDSELFKTVRFVSTSGSGDVFAFDSMTIGAREQVRPPPTGIPEPAPLALLAAALLGLGLSRRRG